MQYEAVKIISQSVAINKYSSRGNHINWILLYLKSGELTVTLNNSVYALQKESLMLIAPDDFYCIVRNNAAHYVCFKFNISNLYDFSSKNRIFKMSGALTELLSSLTSADDKNEQQILLSLLLTQCAKLVSDIAPVNDKKAQLYKEAVTMMERYVASSLSVDDFAEMMNVSLSGLKRIFWEFTGLGVHQYYLMLKIKKAKELLLSGHSVTHTAKVLQFSSQAYFSAVFKRVTGISAKSFSKGKTQLKDTAKPIQASKNKPNVYSFPKKSRSSSTAPRRTDLPDYLL